MADNMSTSAPQTDQRLWSKDFVLNILTAHFIFAGYTALLPIVPLYALHRSGQEWQLGIIIGSFGIVGLLIRPFAGRWVVAAGPKRMVIVGASLVAIGSLLYIPALSVWWIIPVRMFQGVGLAIAPVATSTIVANLAPPSRRAEAMSYMGNAINVSFMYAPFVSSWILEYGGFHNAFLFSAIAASLGVLMAIRISSSRTYIPPSAGPANVKVPLISKAALFPTLVFLTYTFTQAPVSTFLPLLADIQKLGNPGLFFTVHSASSMVAMALGGPIADRFGRSTVIIPGLVATALAMFLLNGAFFQLMFLTAGFFSGLGFGLIQPGIQSFTIDRVPLRERSAGMATLQQAWDVGGNGGAFLLGPVASTIGVANTFGITGIGALIGAAGFILGNAKRPTAMPTTQVVAESNAASDTNA